MPHAAAGLLRLGADAQVLAPAELVAHLAETAGLLEDAIREGHRAIELIPVGKNAIGGARLIQYLAVIYAWTDNKDRAIERLTEAAKLPGSHVTYGDLRLNPFWDPLRGDPRFDAIIASLAPK